MTVACFTITEGLVWVVDQGTSRRGDTADFSCTASYHAIKLAVGSGNEGMVTCCL